MSDEPNFEGHEDRECGEHRTVGSHRWCYEDSEWCYPHFPCRGCELPALRKQNEMQRDIIDQIDLIINDALAMNSASVAVSRIAGLLDSSRMAGKS